MDIFQKKIVKIGNTELEGKTKIAISSHFARDIAFNAINPLTLRCVTLIKQDWQQTADLVNYFLSLVVHSVKIIEIYSHKLFFTKIPGTRSTNLVLKYTMRTVFTELL